MLVLNKTGIYFYIKAIWIEDTNIGGQIHLI